MERWLKYRARMARGGAMTAQPPWFDFLSRNPAPSDKLHRVVLAVISLLPLGPAENEDAALKAISWKKVKSALYARSQSLKYGAAALTGSAAGYYLAPQLEKRLSAKGRRRAATLLGGLTGVFALRTFEELVAAIDGARGAEYDAPYTNGKLSDEDKRVLEADLNRLTFRTNPNQTETKLKIRKCLHEFPSYLQGVHSVCGMFLEHGLNVDQTRQCLLAAERYLGQQWFSKEPLRLKMLLPSGEIRESNKEDFPAMDDLQYSTFIMRYTRLFIPICLDALSDECAKQVWDYVFSSAS